MKRTNLLILVLAATATLAFATDPSKLAKDLPTSGPVTVIVQYKQLPQQGGGLLGGVLGLVGGLLKTVLGIVNAVVATVDASTLGKMSDDPNVVYIAPDRPVHMTLDYANPTLNAGTAYASGWTGAGVGIAVIDSGVSLHTDLMPRVVYSESFDPNGNWTDDRFGHGTHVAGIAAGNAVASTGVLFTHTFRGIAPSANIVNLRVLDANGAGTDSSVIAAISRAIQLKAAYNIRVINLSLGHLVYESYKKDALCKAVEAAWKAGIVVVVAAGNDGRNNSLGTNGYGTINSPGNDPYVITVGAMKTQSTIARGDDQIASYSSKGPTMVDHVVKPDVVAPGNRIVSLRAMSSWLNSNDPANTVPLSYYSKLGLSVTSPSYYKLSGTSMATPMVSGAAALLLQKTPSLTPDQVKARLMKTASKQFPTSSVAIDPVTGASYVSQYDIFTVGAGYVDVTAALANTDIANGSALSPTAYYNSSSHKVYVIYSNSLWVSTPAWSLAQVWGNLVLVNGTSVCWGDSVVWGDKTLSAFSVVWGDSAVWGDSVVWGDKTPLSPTSINTTVNGEN